MTMSMFGRNEEKPPVIVRVETWDGDILRDTEYFTSPEMLVRELTGYVNGGSVESLSISCREALARAGSLIPSVEGLTQNEIPQSLREYVAAEVIRSVGGYLSAQLTLRNQLK